jgi:hypothetical protein
MDSFYCNALFTLLCKRELVGLAAGMLTVILPLPITCHTLPQANAHKDFMAEQVMGILANHEIAALCVSECTDAGVFNQEVGLVTRYSEGDEVVPHSMGMFQKNGDVTTLGGSTFASGLMGSIVGVAIGVATFSIPGLGIYMAVGSLASAICGGTLGATFGREVGKSFDDFHTEANPLHKYIRALRSGEVLCSITVEEDLKEEVSRIVSKYAVTRALPELPLRSSFSSNIVG